jgi:riboflavin kinase/FMN adenylyltransferase
MVKKIKLYKNFSILNKHKNSILLIGNFDGLHIGHQNYQLIKLNFCVYLK